MSANQLSNNNANPLAQSLFHFPTQQHDNFHNQTQTQIINCSNNLWDSSQENPNPSNNLALPTTLHNNNNNIKPEAQNFHNLSSPPRHPFLHHLNTSKTMSMITSPFHVSNPNSATSAHLSATALLQKAATVGSAAITGQPVQQLSIGEFGSVTQLDSGIPDQYLNMRGLITNTRSNEGLTRDFLGLTNGGGSVDVSIDVKDMLTFTGSVEYHPHHHNTMFKSSSQQGFGFLGTTTAAESWGNC